MKSRFTVLFLALAIFVTSCSKDDDNDTSSGISCTIDGKTYTFNTQALATRSDDNLSNGYAIWIAGFSGVAGNSDYFQLTLNREDQHIAAGMYGSEWPAPSSQLGDANLEYLPKGEIWSYESISGTINPTEIIVTSISETSIQGTFKGDVYLTGTGTFDTKKTVASGKFNVKFQ